MIADPPPGFRSRSAAPAASPSGREARRIRRVAVDLLRFERPHTRVAERLADRVVRRWQRLRRPPRGQFLEEWVASALWVWLREEAGAYASSRRKRGPFLRPLSDPVEVMLRPYRAGALDPRRRPIEEALRRTAA